MNNIYKVFEWFAWIWAFSQALQNLNIQKQIVWISEINPHSIAVFQHNHWCVNNFGNISKIVYKNIPDFDIWMFW